VFDQPVDAPVPRFTSIGLAPIVSQTPYGLTSRANDPQIKAQMTPGERIQSAKSLSQLGGVLRNLSQGTTSDPHVADAIVERAEQIGAWFRGTQGQQTPQVVFSSGLHANPGTPHGVDGAIYLSKHPDHATQFATRQNNTAGYLYVVRPHANHNGRGPYSFDPRLAIDDANSLFPQLRDLGITVRNDGTLLYALSNNIIPAAPLAAGFDTSRLTDDHFSLPGRSEEENRIGAIAFKAGKANDEIRTFSHVFPDEVLGAVEFSPDGSRRFIVNESYRAQ
jgi:hypothetical protein